MLSAPHLIIRRLTKYSVELGTAKLSPSTAYISCPALTIAITLIPTLGKLAGVEATKLEQNKALSQNDKLRNILGLLTLKARQLHAQRYLCPAFK